MLGKEVGNRDFFGSYVGQRLLPHEHEVLDIDAMVGLSLVGGNRGAAKPWDLELLGFRELDDARKATPRSTLVRASFTPKPRSWTEDVRLTSDTHSQHAIRRM
jgi:hypothetical protein